jgi:predicted HNH restriction endonuclease
VTQRNPNWTRDELILAVDLYMHHRPSVLRSKSAEVLELSEVLKRLGRPDPGRSPTYRNANAIAMTLQNFRPLDPEYTATGRVGLHHVGKSDREVWREFASDPIRLRQTAAAIRAAIAGQPADATDPNEVDDGMVEAPEGRLLTRLHRQRERDRRLVEAKKKQALQKHGLLSCEVCELQPELKFGSRGRSVIECHHTKPLHTLIDGDRTRLDDLALVCANCHRLIHGGQPWLTLEDLRLSLLG